MAGSATARVRLWEGETLYADEDVLYARHAMLRRIMAVPGGLVCVAKDSLPKLYRVWPNEAVKHDEIAVDEQWTIGEGAPRLVERQIVQINSVPSHYVASWAYIELVVCSIVDRNTAAAFLKLQLIDKIIQNGSRIYMRTPAGRKIAFTCRCSYTRTTVSRNTHSNSAPGDKHLCAFLREHAWARVTAHTVVLVERKRSPTPQESETLPELSAPSSDGPSFTLAPTINRRVYSHLHAIFTSAFATQKPSACSVLLHGPTGSGKSYTLCTLTRDIGVHTIVLRPSDLTPYLCSSASPGTILEPDSLVRNAFYRALVVGWRALMPTVVILDAVESLIPARGQEEVGVSGYVNRLLWLQFMTSMVRLRAYCSATAQVQEQLMPTPKIIVVGVAHDAAALDQRVRRCFDTEVEMRVPVASERLALFRRFLPSASAALEARLAGLSAEAHSYLPADVAAVCGRATTIAAIRELAAQMKAELGAAAAPVASADKDRDRKGYRDERKRNRNNKERDMDMKRGGDRHKGRERGRRLDRASKLRDSLRGKQASSRARATQESSDVNQGMTVDLCDLQSVMQAYSPIPLLGLSSRSDSQSAKVSVPTVRWADIGGHAAVKRALQQMVVWPFLHPAALTRMGVSSPSGILLYGPPGTGKTLLAKATATECSCNFLAVSTSQLIHAEMGESEKSVAAIFNLARDCSPCILFFDEFQALFGSRDNGGQISRRMVSQLLLELDSLNSTQTIGDFGPKLVTAHQQQSQAKAEKALAGRIMVVGATNVPDAVDEAFRRPGRFDRVVFVGPLDTTGRTELFTRLLHQMPWDTSVNVPYLVKATEGINDMRFTGADVSHLCRQAALLALRNGSHTITAAHFEGALARLHAAETRSD